MASRKGSDSMSPTVPPTLDDRHVGVARAALDVELDLVGDVRDDLHRAAEGNPVPLLLDHDSYTWPVVKLFQRRIFEDWKRSYGRGRGPFPRRPQ